MSTEPVIHVVDDDPAMRASTERLLSSNGWRVVAYEGAQAFLDRVELDRPGCVVLDCCMPEMTGLELQERLRREEGACLPIIMITAYGDVPKAVRAFRDGALDFLEKPFDPAVLVQRVREALELGAQWRDVCDRRAEARERIQRLTPRERQVLDLLVEGNANKQMAAALGISPKTVEIHRAHVMEKMQAGSLPELVRLAMAARSAPGAFTDGMGPAGTDPVSP